MDDGSTKNVTEQVSPVPYTHINYTERKELEALSKEVFGSSTKYKKFMEQGFQELVTEEIDDIVPSTKDGEPDTVKKVKVPVKRADGALQYVTKYHTKESIRLFMLIGKEQIDKLKADIERKKQEEEAKKTAERVQEDVGGSAV